MTRRLCAAILSLEAIALGLASPVLITISGLSTAQGLGIGLGMAAACVVIAGLLRFAWAYAAGWVLQLVVIGFGTVVSALYVVGVLFLALWATAWFLGRKIERERAAWEADPDGPRPGR